jgi:hypothetical protein
MYLCELIEALENAPQDLVVPIGFAEPHSYRGYYEDLEFTPAMNVTVASMLAHARSALGATFYGYKGGDYKMHEYSRCWIGEAGLVEDQSISPLLLNFMLGNPAL